MSDGYVVVLARGQQTRRATLTLNMCRPAFQAPAHDQMPQWNSSFASHFGHSSFRERFGSFIWILIHDAENVWVLHLDPVSFDDFMNLISQQGSNDFSNAFSSYDFVAQDLKTMRFGIPILAGRGSSIKWAGRMPDVCTVGLQVGREEPQWRDALEVIKQLALCLIIMFKQL